MQLKKFDHIWKALPWTHHFTKRRGFGPYD